MCVRDFFRLLAAGLLLLRWLQLVVFGYVVCCTNSCTGIRAGIRFPDLIDKVNPAQSFGGKNREIVVYW